MIHKFRCDRCGKTYSPYQTEDMSEFNLVEITEDCILEKDLCQDCYQELVEWFNK